jgi:YD repeat-containing protein
LSGPNLDVAHDLAGNVTSLNLKATNPSESELFNALNQLIKITNQQGSLENRYDEQELLVRSATTSEVTYLIRLGLIVLGEVDEKGVLLKLNTIAHQSPVFFIPKEALPPIYISNDINA